MNEDSFPESDRDLGEVALFSGPANRSIARDWAFCHPVILVVEAPTGPDAVVIGKGTYHRIAERDSTPFDEFQLVADFDDTPSEFLTDRWGHVPGVTSASSAAGERLIDRAIRRTGRVASHCPVDGHDTYLYDGTGNVGYPCRQVRDVPTRSNGAVWVVPAITLHRAPSIDMSVSPF
jgi:hypothetical protein